VGLSSAVLFDKDNPFNASNHQYHRDEFSKKTEEAAVNEGAAAVVGRATQEAKKRIDECCRK
jgi:hypothetical protein